MAWEYHIESINLSDRWTFKKQQAEVAAFKDRLNGLGGEGWELVSYDAVPLTGSFSEKIKGYAYLTFFKRPTE